MNNHNGSIDFVARLKTEEIEKNVAKLEARFRQLTGRVEQEGNRMQNVFSGLESKALAFFSVYQAQKLIRTIVSIRGEFQQLGVAFETMLGNKAKADKLMSEVVDFAAKTPFNLKGVAGGTKQLLAYGIEAENIIPTLKSLGDVSAGLSVPIERLILNYGQIKTQTKLTGRDLRDFNMAGVPLIAELAKNLNKAETEIQEMVSAGKIGFKDVENAFRTMSGEGGRFANLMDKQSKTITGQISNIEDSIDQMFNKIGQSSEGVINGALSGVSYLVEHYEELGKILAGLVLTYGTYRTAMALSIALSKGYTIAELGQYKALLLVEKAQKLLNTTMLSNPYVLVATAVVGLATAMWAFRDSTTASEKALENHKKRLKETSDLIAEQKEEVEKLIATVKDENESREVRRRAFNKLKSLMPEVFKQYKTEEELIKNITKAYKDLNTELGNKSTRSNVQAVKSTEERIKQLEDENKKILDNSIHRGGFDKTSFDRNLKRIDELKERLKLEKKQVEKDRVIEFEVSISEKSKEDAVLSLQAIEQELKRRTSKVSKDSKQNDASFNGLNPFAGEETSYLMALKKSLKETIANREKENKTLKNKSQALKEIAELDKKLNPLQDKYNKSKKNGGLTDKEFTDYQDLKKRKEDLQKELKSFGNEVSKKTTKKEFDAVKNTREEAKLLRNAELEKEEARISIMREGAEKRQALIQLDFDRREETINQRFEDEKQKLIELAKERAKAEGKSFNPDSVNLSSIKESRKVLLEANAENYDRETNKHFKELLDKYKTFEEQKAKIAKQYDEEINALERQNQDGKYNAKIELAKAFKQKELTELEISAGQTKSVIGSIFTDLNKKSVEELDKMVASGEDAFKRLEDAFKDSEDPEMIQMLDTIRNKLEEIRNKADKIRSPFQKLDKDFKKLFDKNSTKSEQIQVFSGIQEGVNNALAGVNMLSDAFRSISEISGDETFGGIAEGLSNVADLTNKTMQGFQAGMALGGPVGGAIGGAIGLVTGVINKIGESNKRHREAILRIQQSEISQQRELNKLLLEERFLMKDKESPFGIKELSKAIGYLAIYRDEFEKLQDSLHKKRDRVKDFGFGFKLNFKATDLENIKIKTGHKKTGLFGWGKGRDLYSGILKEYPELLDKNKKFNRQLAESIIKNREFGEKGKEALQQIIDQYDSVQKAQELFDGYIKSTFGELGNSFVDSVVTSLEKGEDAFKSFGKSVGNVIGKLGRQLVEELFVTDKFNSLKETIRNIYDDRNLSLSEKIKNAKGAVLDFSTNIKKDLERAKEVFKPFYEVQKSLDPSKIENPQAQVKGFQSMSQDVGSDLNGKFTLMVELKRKHFDVSLDISKNIKMLQQNSAQALRHLSNIDNHTSRLSNIENGISGIRTTLEDIQLKGIKIK